MSIKLSNATRIKIYLYLWRLQSITAFISAICNIIMIMIWWHFFAGPGNNAYTLRYIILPILPYLLTALFIAVGSLLRWRLALVANLVTLYQVYDALLILLTTKQNYPSFLAMWSNLSLVSHVVMGLCGARILGNILAAWYKAVHTRQRTRHT